jgi:hypothetical protein
VLSALELLVLEPALGWPVPEPELVVPVPEEAF